MLVEGPTHSNVSCWKHPTKLCTKIIQNAQSILPNCSISGWEFSPSHRSRDGNAWGSVPKLLKWWSRCHRPGNSWEFQTPKIGISPNTGILGKNGVRPQLGLPQQPMDLKQANWVFNYRTWRIEAMKPQCIEQNGISQHALRLCIWTLKEKAGIS